MGIVYEATDRLSGERVALKRVTIDHQSLLTSFGRADSNLLLAQEFRIQSSLRHPHIVSVYDYGFDSANQPFFTMALLHNAVPITQAAQNATPETILRWITEVLQALRYLHQNGIIHRDLKPSNVLIQDGMAYVLDFGLAIDHPQKTEIVGTVAYLAPEILNGEPTTIRSDLYAVGIIAYECFTGEHPFNLNGTMWQMIQDILHKPIPKETLLESVPNPAIADVIFMLLAKNPEERFASAEQTLIALKEHGFIDVSIESPPIRESHLQAAKFIGRANALGQLQNALYQASDGIGSTWIIEGESGVGKSRLAEEVRIQALVAGMNVLRGQAIKNGGPFHIWHSILRALCLSTHISSEEASILKPLVPDIAALIGQAVPTSTALEASQAEQRLIQTIVNIIQRQMTPLLIILEDIQWSSDSTLTLLQNLRQATRNLPVVILATLRSEEGSHLQTTFHDWNKIQLEPFTSSELKQLVHVVLGEEDSEEEALLNFLSVETEGNALFTIEVMRALAEMYGSLAAIKHVSIPTSIISDNIQTVLRHRLAQMPAEELELLQITAIIGRHLDQRLLENMRGMALDDWLSVGMAARVFEVSEQQWRFAHDKLRETVLADISADILPQLHRRVAEAMRTLYGHDANYYAPLAFHFEQANAPQPAADYYFKAAMEAYKNYARPEALDYARRAAALYAASATDTLIQAKVSFFIAEMLYVSGKSNASYAQYLHTAKLLGIQMPTSQRGFQLGILKNLAHHALRELLPFWRGNDDPELVSLRARTVGRAASSLLFNFKSLEGLYYALKSINLAMAAKPQNIAGELSRRYSLMFSYAPNTFLHRLARYYVQQGLHLEALAASQNELHEMGYIFISASAYAIYMCDWRAAMHYSERCIQLNANGQHWWLYEYGWMLKLEALMRPGNWDEGRKAIQYIYGVYEKLGSISHVQVTLRWHYLMKIVKGDLGAAEEILLEISQISPEHLDSSDQWLHATKSAFVYALQNNEEAARPYAEAALAALHPRMLSLYYVYEGIVELLEYYLWRYQTTPNLDTAHRFQRLLKLLRRHQRLYPISRAMYLLFLGRWQMQLGYVNAADKQLRRALKVAEKYGLKYDAALAAFYLYQLHAQANAPIDKQSALLHDARARLEALGAKLYLHQLPAEHLKAHDFRNSKP
ncbi:MAG: hypothetical protein D6711_13100, partial [Chloroflexi bacterium]